MLSSRYTGVFTLILLALGYVAANQRQPNRFSVFSVALARPGGGGGHLKRQLACTCQEKVCGCCARIDLPQFNFNQIGCLNLTYNPEDLGITLNVLLNDNSIYETSVSGRNPPPICIPIPQLPAVALCVRLYDIRLEGQNVRACIKLEVQVQSNTILDYNFDCVSVGPGGVSLGVSKLITQMSEDYDYVVEAGSQA